MREGKEPALAVLCIGTIPAGAGQMGFPGKKSTTQVFGPKSLVSCGLFASSGGLGMDEWEENFYHLGPQET
jgi:hypothetical protein